MFTFVNRPLCYFCLRSFRILLRAGLSSPPPPAHTVCPLPNHRSFLGNTATDDGTAVYVQGGDGTSVNFAGTAKLGFAAGTDVVCVDLRLAGSCKVKANKNSNLTPIKPPFNTTANCACAVLDSTGR